MGERDGVNERMRRGGEEGEREREKEIEIEIERERERERPIF